MPIHKNIFSDKEAWGIYRLSAFGEAFGWTLLIGSLGAQKYLMHGNKILVSFAGQIHGLLFFAYIAAVLATYASLGWSFKKGFLIGLMSVPPYGTLVAEMWLSRVRKNKEESIKPFIRVFVLIRNQGKYLFVEKREENIETPANEKNNFSANPIEIQENLEEKLLIEKNAILNVSSEKIKYVCSKGHGFCGKCKNVWHNDDCNEDKSNGYKTSCKDTNCKLPNREM